MSVVYRLSAEHEPIAQSCRPVAAFRVGELPTFVFLRGIALVVGESGLVGVKEDVALVHGDPHVRMSPGVVSPKLMLLEAAANSGWLHSDLSCVSTVSILADTSAS